MNMIERVARAMARKRIELLNKVERRNYDEAMIVKCVEASYPNYLDNAKTAIEAMKEPTEEMLLGCDSRLVHGELEQIYTSMIEAALKE